MTRHGAWLIQRYDTVTSTMDRAAALARDGARERTAVRSDEQTAGRGRGGRPWQSPRGAAIYSTLILRPPVSPDRLSTLSLVAGVAVAEAIELVTGASARLKWPNDIWLGDDPARQKVAGILLTSQLSPSGVEFVLLGIGINVATQAEALPDGGTSILAATGREVAPDTLFEALLLRMDDGYDRYLAAQGRPSLAPWLERAVLIGEIVTVEDAGREHTGVFAGIDEDGALLLEDAAGRLRRIVAGDLVRGPRLGPGPRPCHQIS